MKTLLTDEAGSALVEVALALPMMALLLAGTINYGVYLQRRMQVTVAASAGATYASVPGNQNNTTGMSNAAKAASPALSGLTVTSSLLYACAYGTAPTASVSCGTGVTPIQYVQVQTSATVPALVGIVGLPASVTVKGQAVSRVLN